MKYPEPRKKPEFSYTSIDGQKVWPTEVREQFFRKKSGELATKLMGEWCGSGVYGKIENVGPLIDIARKMPGDAFEKTAEGFFNYYFKGDMVKTREDDTHTLAYGSKRARVALAHKYHCNEEELAYYIKVRNPQPPEGIVGVMRQMYRDIQDGRGRCLRPNEVTYEQVVNLVFHEIYDRALVGIQREATVENWVKENFSRKGITIIESDQKTDVSQGVDYELTYRGRILAGIQVKGASFKQNDFESRMMRLSAQQEVYKRRTGAEVLMAYVEGKKGRMHIVNSNNLENEIKKCIRDVDREIERYHRSRTPQQQTRPQTRNTRNEIER